MFRLALKSIPSEPLRERTGQSTYPQYARIAGDGLVRVARVTRVVEEAFITNRDQVVGVDGLDERRDLAGPLGDSRSCTCSRTRATPYYEVRSTQRRGKVGSVPSAAPAPRFVGKLPAQDRGLVLVASNKCLYVGLERSLVLDISTSRIIIYAECLR